MTNIVANPDMTPTPITIIPHVTFGRGATPNGDRVVFNGTSHAPFVSADFDEACVHGHTYRVVVNPDSVTGTLTVSTYGDDPQTLGIVTTTGETALDFVAFGTEAGVTVMGALNNCAASFPLPTVAD